MWGLFKKKFRLPSNEEIITIRRAILYLQHFEMFKHHPETSIPFFKKPKPLNGINIFLPIDFFIALDSQSQMHVILEQRDEKNRKLIKMLPFFFIEMLASNVKNVKATG